MVCTHNNKSQEIKLKYLKLACFKNNLRYEKQHNIGAKIYTGRGEDIERKREIIFMVVSN